MTRFDSAIEAAAKAIYCRVRDIPSVEDDCLVWARTKDKYREEARAAVTTFLDTMLDEHNLSVIICAEQGHTGGIECEPDIDTARGIVAYLKGEQ